MELINAAIRAKQVIRALQELRNDLPQYGQYNRQRSARSGFPPKQSARYRNRGMTYHNTGSTIDNVPRVPDSRLSNPRVTGTADRLTTMCKGVGAAQFVNFITSQTSKTQ